METRSNLALGSEFRSERPASRACTPELLRLAAGQGPRDSGRAASERFTWPPAQTTFCILGSGTAKLKVDVRSKTF